MKNNTFRKIILVVAVVVLSVSLFTGCNLIRRLIGLDETFQVEADKFSIEIGEEYLVGLSADSPNANFKLESTEPSKVQIIDNTKIKGLSKTTDDVLVKAYSDSGKTDEFYVEVTYCKVKEVGIKANGTPIQIVDDGVLFAQPITFEAVTNKDISPDTKFYFEVKEKDTGKVVKTYPSTQGVCVFTPVKKGVVYEVTTSTNGLTSKPIECGFFNTIYISSNKQIYGLTDEVEINVLFRLEKVHFLPTTEKIQVYVNDVYEKDINLNCPANAEVCIANINLGILAEGDYTICFKYGTECSNKVSVSVQNLVAIDHIKIVESGNLLQKGAKSAVTFTATLDPIDAKAGRIQWYVNDKLQETKGATFTFTPPTNGNGEYHIYALGDKTKSNVLTVVSLTQFENTITNYLDTAHHYGGYPQNRYITSQDEMNNIVRYALENQLYGKGTASLELYVEHYNSKSIQDKIKEARLSADESGVIAGSQMSTSGQKVTINFDYTAEDGLTPITNRPSGEPVNSQPDAIQKPQSKPCYTIGNYTRHFYIDRVDIPTMQVSTSNMLYKAVMWGYRPEISVVDTNLQRIYQNAKDVLSHIITDDMTDLEKVHAIYDWIVYNVRYDFDLASLGGVSLNDSMKCNGYYLEGIFGDMTDSHAVCDGKSKAFVLMCGIEGIESIRVTGVAGQGEKKGGHAWNKVLLDTNQDGVKDWYVVDTTWGDVSSMGFDKIDEYLTHSYFLLTDYDIRNTHIEDENKTYPKARGEYDYYDNKTFTYGGKEYDYLADDKVELGAIIKNAVTQNDKFIEVKLNYNFGGESGFKTVVSNNLGFGTRYLVLAVTNDIYCVIIL